MSHIGLKSPVAGMPCRPIIPKQKETMLFVWDYFQKLNGAAVALCRPLHSSGFDILFQIPQIPEKPAHERWLLNQNYMKQLRAARNAGA